MSTYTDTVDTNMEGCELLSVGVCPGCEECQDVYGYDSLEEFEAAYDAGDIVDEGGFSWSACECCRSSLGGSRCSAHYVADGEIQHIDVCEGCLIYLANGDAPTNWEG